MGSLVFNYTRIQSSCFEFLFLGSLRYIGRAFTLDYIEEETDISHETNRAFLHSFLLHEITILYDKRVTQPATVTYHSLFDFFAYSGFNGCIELSDGTHIGMLSCVLWATYSHTGYTLSFLSRTRNKTVTHWHQILGTTKCHPAT